MTLFASLFSFDCETLFDLFQFQIFFSVFIGLNEPKMAKGDKKFEENGLVENDRKWVKGILNG